MTDIVKNIIIPLITAVSIGGISYLVRNQNDLSKKYHNYSGKLEDKSIYTTTNKNYFGEYFQICEDKEKKSGLHYLICYKDKKFDKIVDEIWINGADVSSNKEVMRAGQKKYEDLLKKMYNQGKKDSEKKVQEQKKNYKKRTKELIDML